MNGHHFDIRTMKLEKSVPSHVNQVEHSTEDLEGEVLRKSMVTAHSGENKVNKNAQPDGLYLEMSLVHCLLINHLFSIPWLVLCLVAAVW